MRFVGLDAVPAVISREELESAKRRAKTAAELSGAKGPLVFIGAGMTALVFCDERERAFKTARFDEHYKVPEHGPIHLEQAANRKLVTHLLDHEAAWLEDIMPTSVRPHVAKFYKYYPELLVIERECVKGRRPYWREEDDVVKVHEQILIASNLKGWTAPEYKLDAYVMHETRGPVLVDAGFANPLGTNLLRDVREGLVELERRLRVGGKTTEWDKRWLQDAAFQIREEKYYKRLTASQADPVLDRLYLLGAPRDNPPGTPPGVPQVCTAEQHARAKETRWSQLPAAGKGSVRYPDGTVLEYRNCPVCKSTLVKEVAGPGVEQAKENPADPVDELHARLCPVSPGSHQAGRSCIARDMIADAYVNRLNRSAEELYEKWCSAGSGFRTDRDRALCRRVIDEALAAGRTKNPPRAAAGNDFGVFVWRQDGLYPRSNALAVYARKGDAERNAEKRNQRDPVHVVRTLKKENPDYDEGEDKVVYLYHVTYAGLLPEIARRGLRPNAGRGIGNNAYSGHSKGRIFYTAGDGVGFWHSKLEQHAEHDVEGSSDEFKEMVPVVLRIDDSDGETGELEKDPAGTSDARAEAFIGTRKVPPGAIDFWDGAAWQPIADHDVLDPEAALEWVSDSEEDDEDYEGYWTFKTYSPLMPPDEELAV